MPIDEKEYEKRIKELGKIFQKEIDDLKKEVEKLKKEKMDQADFYTKLKEIFGEKNFDKNNNYIGGSATTQPPVSNPTFPQKPDEGTKPSKPSAEPDINDPWYDFFNKHRDKIRIWELNEWKDNFTPAEAEEVFTNGFEEITASDTSGLTNLSNRHADYTSKGHTTKNVDLIKYKRKDLNKVHNIIYQLKETRRLTDLLTYSDIENSYKEEDVPNGLKYKDIKIIWEEKQKELFRKAFEWNKPSGLRENDIDVWRKANTGLKLNGSDQRKAYDNGWNDFVDHIANGKVEFGEDKGLDVLIISKNQLDIANAILKDINDESKHNSNKSLPVNYRADEISKLVDDQLPNGKKQQDLTNRIIERRKTFFYFLDDPEDGGIDKTESQKAFDIVNKEENGWKPKPKKSITVQVLNEVLSLASNETSPMNLTEWLEKNGGYYIDQNIIDAEEKFTGEDEWRQSGLMLGDCYKRFNFYPENPEFCDNSENPTKGILPFQTGVGKSTRVPACIYGCSREKTISTGEDKTWNIIIVLPNGILAQDTFDHHNNWLQKDENGRPWRCPYHGRAHSQYKTLLNDLTYYDEVTFDDVTDSKTKEEVATNLKRKKGVGEKGISIMEPSVLISYLNRDLFKVGKVRCSGIESEKKWVKGAKKEAKSKLISKEWTIIMFDEKHFTRNGSTDYQTTQEWTIKLGYKVIMASATFPGKDFCLTLPHKIDRLWMPVLVEEYTNSDGKKVNLNDVLAKGKTFVFLQSAELTKPQEEALKDYSYSVFNQSLEKSSTGVSYGLEPGSVMFGDDRYSIGFTLDVDVCISVGEIALRELLTNWAYKKIFQPLPMPNLVQRGGRVARRRDGIFIFCTKKKPGEKGFLGEVNASNDKASLMVETVLAQDITKLAKYYPRSLNDIDLVQAAVAMPFPDNKWRYPEEILIGLTKGTSNYPKYGVQTKPASADNDLWERHLGTYVEPVPEKAQAENLLSLTIFTFLERKIKDDKGNWKNNFPAKLDIEIESPLVKQSGLKLKDADSITKVKKILIGALQKLKSTYEMKDDDNKFYPNEKKSKSQETIQTIADLCRLANEANKDDSKIIEIIQGKDKKGKLKEDLILKISYPHASKRFLEIEPEVARWDCNVCLTRNSDNDYCKACGFRRDRNNKTIVYKNQENFTAQILQENK